MAVLEEVLGDKPEEFANIVRQTYTCRAEAVLQEDMVFAKSPVVRQVEPKETMEVIEIGRDEDIGVPRIRVILDRDGATGWVTQKGNQGTVYFDTKETSIDTLAAQ
jgi:hypothetical protein